MLHAFDALASHYLSMFVASIEEYRRAIAIHRDIQVVIVRNQLARFLEIAGDRGVALDNHHPAPICRDGQKC
jgi:hypothetical protein